MESERKTPEVDETELSASSSESHYFDPIDVASEVPQFDSPKTSDVSFPMIVTRWSAHTSAESAAISKEFSNTMRQNMSYHSLTSSSSTQARAPEFQTSGSSGVLRNEDDQVTWRNLVPQLNRFYGQFRDRRSLSPGSSTLSRLSRPHHQGRRFSQTENFGDFSYPSQNNSESFIQKQSVHNFPSFAPHAQVTGDRNAGSFSGSGLQRCPSPWLNDQPSHPLGPTIGGPVSLSRCSANTNAGAGGLSSPARASGQASTVFNKSGPYQVSTSLPGTSSKRRKPSTADQEGREPKETGSRRDSGSLSLGSCRSERNTEDGALLAAHHPPAILHKTRRLPSATKQVPYVSLAPIASTSTSISAASPVQISGPSASLRSRRQAATSPSLMQTTFSPPFIHAASRVTASVSDHFTTPTLLSSLPSTAQASCLPLQAQFSARPTSLPTRDQSTFNLFPIASNPAACRSSRRPAKNMISLFPNSPPATLPGQLPGQKPRGWGTASSHLVPPQASNPSSSGQASQAPEPAEMAPCYHIKWKVKKATAEESGYRCLLCKRDVLYAAEGPYVLPKESPEVGVLPCGHCFHGLCLERITPDDQARDPPCIPCALAEACD